MMKTKKVHFIFDAQFCGKQEIIKDINENEIDEDTLINKLFPEVMGLSFDMNCIISIPEDNIIIRFEEDNSLAVFETESIDSLYKKEKIQEAFEDIINRLNSLKEILMED